MNPYENLLNTFYTAFQSKDFETMKNCYHADGTFNDAVFQNLNAREAGLMWEMLIKSGKDLKIEFTVREADENLGKASWTATYTFSKTQRKVVNQIQAEFSFKDGKILHHRDHFDFYRWARQALGFPGFLLGWTGFFRRKVQDNARQRLNQFIQSKATV